MNGLWKYPGSAGDVVITSVT